VAVAAAGADHTEMMFVNPLVISRVLLQVRLDVVWMYECCMSGVLLAVAVPAADHDA
jgi:hypothetical protein